MTDAVTLLSLPVALAAHPLPVWSGVEVSAGVCMAFWAMLLYPVVFPVSSPSRRTSTLLPVRHVLGVGSCVEMRWVAARRVIAFMQTHPLSKLVFGVREIPSQAVSRLPIALIEPEAAVIPAFWCFGSLCPFPGPAFVGFSDFDLRPEALGAACHVSQSTWAGGQSH